MKGKCSTIFVEYHVHKSTRTDDWSDGWTELILTSPSLTLSEGRDPLVIIMSSIKRLTATGNIFMQVRQKIKIHRGGEC